MVPLIWSLTLKGMKSGPPGCFYGMQGFSKVGARIKRPCNCPTIMDLFMSEHSQELSCRVQHVPEIRRLNFCVLSCLCEFWAQEL